MRGNAIGTHHEPFGEFARSRARDGTQLLELRTCVAALTE
jgi:hypothetical protein